VARTPSDADLRAVLIALTRRAGGAVEVTNAELYDAMMPDLGMQAGHFVVEETHEGIRLVLADDESS
jgi:hypothetical protein